MSDLFDLLDAAEVRYRACSLRAQKMTSQALIRLAPWRTSSLREACEHGSTLATAAEVLDELDQLDRAAPASGGTQ